MFSLLRTSGFASARRAFSTSPISRHDFAKITVLGRLATEPELTTTPGGKEMVRYTVVVVSGKEKNSGKEVPVSYYRVANFDPDSPKRAFLMSCAKGSLVMVEGEATLRPYESEDGAKHFSFGVIQRTFTAIIPKRSQEQELQEKWASMAGA